MPKSPTKKKVPPPTLAPTKAAKKKHDAMMPVRPPKGRVKETPGMAVRRARVRKIIDRTKAAQLELDELAEGAELGDLRGLPVMQIGPRRAPNTSWRNPTDHDDPPPAATVVLPRKQSDIYLIESKRTCGSCGLQDHPGIACKELDAWLAHSAKVLAGEVADVDPELRRLAEEQARAPKKRGRRRKYPTASERFTAMTPEQQVAYLLERDAKLKTAKAASPSPEPNPST